MKTILLNICTLVFIFISACTSGDPNNGIKEEYYPNGVIKAQISLKNGLKNGITKYYDSKGRLASETEYKDDLKHGKLINYSSETGKPILEAMFENDAQHGPVIQYYREGMLFRESTYKNGRVDGVVKTFWPDGKIKAENEFAMGKPATGLKEYDKNGNLIEQPVLVIKNPTGFNQALEITLKGDFENAEFYASELIDEKYFDNRSRKLRSENRIAYYNFTTQRNPGIISIVAKVKTNYGNTLILQKSVKP